jgi:hypothetical protein
VAYLETADPSTADQTEKVSSWVADGGPSTTADRLEKRYPWEAFANVGFRTVINPAP